MDKGLEFKTQNQLTAHSSECFLISCMDFRLIDDLVVAMNNMGFNNNYDQFILAGSSLGFTQKKFKHWGQAVLDHMEIGKELHHFREIIIFDHMDCGAYKKFFPEMKTREEEIKLHHEHLQKAYSRLHQKFPNMKFRAFLMELDGAYKEITISKQDSSYEEHHFLDEENSKFLSEIQMHHAKHNKN